MAVDCLAGYLWTGRQQGAKIPAPSAAGAMDPQAVAADLEIGDASECFVRLVSVDVEQYAGEHFAGAV